MVDSEENFTKCLQILPNCRTIQDILCIRSYLKTIEALKCYKDITISEYARIARYECYEAHSLLYRQGDICTSWYIVLSGCVLVGQTLYFSRKNFGHRVQGSLHRYDECLILEDTELIVFDYSLDRQAGILRRKPYPTLSNKEASESSITLTPPSSYNGSMSKRSSHASDTSSAYSGCYNMSEGKGNSCGNPSYASDNEEDDDDDDDGDDADLDSISHDFSVTDTFYDTIIKEPSQRTELDIETILDGVQNLVAFANFTAKTKYELCKVMRVALVNNAEERIMEDGQVLDTWNVVLDGVIEVRQTDGAVREYARGDCFGVRPSLDEQKQIGDIWTITPTCVFFCVLQKEFCDIMSRSRDCIIPETEENGRVVLLYEEKNMSSDKSKSAKVIVKGTAEKLLHSLIFNQHKSDPMFVENFLLTYRIFFKSPLIVAKKLCDVFSNESKNVDTKTKENIRKCLVMWANNHFADLDDPKAGMTEYFEKFENMFFDTGCSSCDKSLFFLACSSNSKPRFITLKLGKCIPFRVAGLQNGWGLFIKEIKKDEFEDHVDLRKGDQILSIANQSLEGFGTLDKAVELLRKNFDCSIDLVVRYNPSDLYELMCYFSGCETGIECESPNKDSLTMSGSLTLHGISDHMRVGLNSVITPMALPRPNEFFPISPPVKPKNNTRSANTSPSRQTVQQRRKKYSASVEKEKRSLGSRSCSNPNLKAKDDNSSICYSTSVKSIDQVIKVYKPGSTDNKFILVTNNTPAKDALPLILKEFSINESEVENYALYLVTVDSGQNGAITKCSRVGPFKKNLGGDLSLNQRYFLKHNNDSILLSDEYSKSILNESKVTIHQLSAIEIATRLTFFDYTQFKDIQAAEYINFIFKLPALKNLNDADGIENNDSSENKSSLDGFSTGHENYDKFEYLINRESFWPTTEICSETNINRRADLIKKFIKVAKFCKELKNFNSLMCIITGLTLTPVSRLKQTWEKVPNKYIRMYDDLSTLMDMSLNFRRIRQLVSPEVSEPPLIPCLAIHSKDLTAMHLGNKNVINNLINFEKFRMMSSEIRKLIRMCNTEYSLQTIISSLGNTSSNFFNISSPSYNHQFDESDATSGISGCSNNSEYFSKKGRSNSVDQSVLSGTLKKNSKRKSLSISEANPKNNRKIYDIWLSTLKVRTYLSNVNTELDIKKLQEMSESLEPSALALSNSTASVEFKTSSSTVKQPTPKSSITINLNGHKSNDSSQATVESTPNCTVSSSTMISSPNLIISPNVRQRSRPQSFFSCQTPEDTIKLKELIQSSRKVVPKRQPMLPNYEINMRASNNKFGPDSNMLRNIPMYNRDFHFDISTRTAVKPANYIPGGTTLSLQSLNVSQQRIGMYQFPSVPERDYCYPPANLPFGSVYYGEESRKFTKRELPSYEAAVKIQRTRNSCRPNESFRNLPPVGPSKQTTHPPSYDQHISKSKCNIPNQCQQIRSSQRGAPPPPPPRTITMSSTQISPFQNNERECH